MLILAEKHTGDVHFLSRGSKNYQIRKFFVKKHQNAELNDIPPLNMDSNACS